MRETRDMEIRRQKSMESEVEKFRGMISSVIDMLNRETDAMRTASHTLSDVANSTTVEANAAAKAALASPRLSS